MYRGARLYSAAMRTLWTSIVLVIGLAPPVVAQIRAQPRAGASPPWSKGISAISPESYYHAIECGKQGGDDPPCLFWDTGLCRNDDFAIAMYTPYKQVKEILLTRHRLRLSSQGLNVTRSSSSANNLRV